MYVHTALLRSLFPSFFLFGLYIYFNYLRFWINLGLMVPLCFFLQIHSILLMHPPSHHFCGTRLYNWSRFYSFNCSFRTVVAAVLPTVVLGSGEDTALVSKTVTVVLTTVVLTTLLPFGCCFFATFLAHSAFINSFRINFNTISTVGEFANKIWCTWMITDMMHHHHHCHTDNIPGIGPHNYTYNKH